MKKWLAFERNEGMDAWRLHETLNRGEAGSWLTIKGVLVKWLLDRRILSKDAIPVLLDDFSLKTILGFWSGFDVACSVGDEERPSREEKSVLSDYFQKGDSLLDEHPQILGQLYQSSHSSNHQKQKGVFYTPWSLIQTLMDGLEVEALHKQRILDPSCGVGFVLQGWYDRLLREYQAKGCPDREAHERILQENLFGVDVDPKAVAVAALSLQLRQDHYVPTPHIQTSDFLLDPFPWSKVDLIAGNPPYIGHKQLDRQVFQELKERYPRVFYDKADVAYCFFQRGLELLENGGKLAFITSRYFLEAQNGQGIRRLLREQSRILSLYDYYGFRPFKEAKVDPAITFLQKRTSSEDQEFVWIRRFQKEMEDLSPPYEVSLTRLTQEGWVLPNREEDAIMGRVQKKQAFLLQDLWVSRQGVITGLDKAFVLNEEETVDYPPAYLHPWIKNSQVQAFQVLPSTKWILYTDGLERPEEEPQIFDRLMPFRESLAQRRECKLGRRPWHHLQWGRDPAFFLGEKIVYPYKSATNRFAVDPAGCFYSADVYGFTLTSEKSRGYTNKSMAALLNSTLYERYFQQYGKKLGRDLYEYYPNTIGRLPVPSMTPGDIQTLEDFYEQMARSDEKQKQKNRENLDLWVFCFFELSKEERAFLLKSKGDGHEKN